MKRQEKLRSIINEAKANRDGSPKDRVTNLHWKLKGGSGEGWPWDCGLSKDSNGVKSKALTGEKTALANSQSQEGTQRT